MPVEPSAIHPSSAWSKPSWVLIAMKWVCWSPVCFHLQTLNTYSTPQPMISFIESCPLRFTMWKWASPLVPTLASELIYWTALHRASPFQWWLHSSPPLLQSLKWVSSRAPRSSESFHPSPCPCLAVSCICVHSEGSPALRSKLSLSSSHPTSVHSCPALTSSSS